MTSLRLWKLLLASMLAFLVLGCKPLASFTVTPEPLVAGQVATFDASETMVAPKPRDNEVVSYQWKFGDGGTGSGKIAVHTYPQAGTYTVELQVRDKAGRESSISEQVVVEAGGPTGSTTPLNVVVMGADGALLLGASATLETAIATTNSSGLATFPAASAGTGRLLRVRKEGFVTQTLSLDLNADTRAVDIAVKLLPVSEVLHIEEASDAQALMSRKLGASVVLPEQALVTATGAAAIGPISLQFTPWDVRSDDMGAMLGHAKSLNAQGAASRMTPIGMMTVDFVDAAGNKLNLGANKTADIQMDLNSDVLNGETLDVGSALPLAHFDETSGLWREEGMGVVIASESSPVGLAVKGTVGHFSTWGMGVFTTGAPQSQINVKCVTPQGAFVRCSMEATSIRSDGTQGGWRIWAQIADDPTVVPLERELGVVWQGVTSGGMTGTITTMPNESFSEVVIVVGPTPTSNFVQCVLPGGIPVACDATLTGTNADGSAFSKVFFVPLQGATIRTDLPEASNLSWQAKALHVVGQSTLLNTGSASSGTSGNVNIQLGADLEVTSRTARVRCDPDTNTAYGSAAVLDACLLQVVVRDPRNAVQYSYQAQIDPNVYFSIPIPLGGSASVQARGIIRNPADQFSNPYQELELTYDGLSARTSYTMYLVVTII